MNDKIRQNGFPILAALIWGTAFVAQSVSTDFVEPMTFNALRSAIATVVLLVVLWAFRRFGAKPQTAPREKGSRKDLILGGICCGAALCIASNLQQAGLSDTTAGKAGFITALYIVIVPLLGLFLRKRAPLTVWIGVVLALAGLYFLCITESLSIQQGDLYILACAVVFSVHILLIDHFTQRVDGIALSCAQFLVAAILSGIGMLLFEHPDWQSILQCTWPILYVGVFSSGIAYTLQILAQKGANPTVVTLLLSLESVFSVLAGALILGDRLSGREIIGCVLMFAAVVLAQLPVGGKEARQADIVKKAAD